jgi:alpha-aminoadipic semialdehyde synthase
VFTGSGNVTKGALEIFDRLPFEEVAPEDLARLATDAERPRNVLYRLHLERSQRYEHRAGAAFDARELADHPERYRGTAHAWLPHALVLVNGAFWAPGLPPLVGRDDLAELYRADSARLRVIGDIACDVDGAVAATVRLTTPDDPLYVYDPYMGAAAAPGTARGPLVLAVDNLPCELPLESSGHFGDALERYVPALARCDWSASLANLRLPAELRRAVIAHRGALVPELAVLAERLSERPRAQTPP